MASTSIPPQIKRWESVLEQGRQRLPAELRSAFELRWSALGAAETVLAGFEGADRRWLDTLPRVWACSDFVAQSIIKDPQLLHDLSACAEPFRARDPAELSAAAEAVLSASSDEADPGARLRRLRRREMVRLAWRNLAGWADLSEVMTTMTALAEACLQVALSLAYRSSVTAFGTPLGADSGEPQPMVILGLGKLGGSELNFSSDIDLIFTYPEDGQTDGGAPRSNHEFFRRVGQRLIKLLDEVTPEGFVFRVDMRLRPNGGSGPLALSFGAMEHYYQAHGRDWERYALIKARVVAGDREQGAVLLNGLRPFVYRKYLDYGAFEALRDMKGLIEREVDRKGIDNNLKLGTGGIREIEFLAQSFQLIRGGRDRALQTSQLMSTLARLGETGVLDADAVRQLGEAYVFLRNAEHCLQMVADQQVHQLPDDGTGQARLAFAMGFADFSAFDAALAQARGAVNGHFRRILHSDDQRDGDAGPLRDLWLDVLDPPAAEQLLVQAGYDDPAAARSLLEHLRRGANYRAFSAQGRNRMDALMPLLVVAAGKAASPTLVLTRLVHVIESIGRRSAYLALLMENPTALQQLVKLCATSAWIANWIARHPVLLDELIDPIVGYRPRTVEDLTAELRRRLDYAGIEDLEARMEVLREFRHAHMLQVAAADLAGLLQPEQVNVGLCRAAEAILGQALQVSEDSLARRYGLPRADGDQTPDFAIVAYGKLGSYELGYNSDLDVIFLYDSCATGGTTVGGQRQLSNEHYFGRLGQRLMHVLGTRTQGGILYEIDTRLRPSGRSGPLVVSVSAFEEYQRQRAWTWEHQALVRARVVAGTASTRERFEALRREVLCVTRDESELKTAIAGMRDNMIAANSRSSGNDFDLKLDRGGIVDIEFIVQYCVLRWAATCPELTIPRDNLGLWRTIDRLGLLPPECCAGLIDAYRQFLRKESELKLAEKSPLIGGDELVEPRRVVTEAWAAIFQ